MRTDTGSTGAAGSGRSPEISWASGFVQIIALIIKLPLFILWAILSEKRSDQDGDDVIYLSPYHWEKVWRRDQHVITHLSRSRKVLCVTPFPVTLFVRSHDEDFLLPGEWVSEQVFAMSVPVLVGESKLPFIKSVNRAYINSILKRKCHQLGISPRVLWFSHPYAEAITTGWEGASVVYDVQDEYPAMPTAPKNVYGREVRLLRKADLVLTGTYSLYLKKKEFARNIHYVPCGVDFEHFNRACDKKLEIPADMGPLMGEKTLGYFGEIGQRIDWKLLREIGDRHPDWSIVLIGGVSYVDPEARKLSNIHIIGKRDYGALPEYIKAFDVCLIPFKMDDLTRYIHPTKLLEYLSAGKPVISNPIPDVERFYSDIVGIAGDVETFEQEMADFENGSERIERGIKMAKETSWQAAVGQMEKHLCEAVTGSKRGRKKDG